jgi:anti-sigma B factor antagonist
MGHARSLSVESRRFGDVIVLTCVGRVVAGDEAAVLEQHVTSLLPDDSLIVLNWHDVHYIDSGGIGLTVRLLNRTRTAGGDLKLCAVSEHVREILKITRLDKVFDLRETEADAIAAFRRPHLPVDAPFRPEVDILCVQEAADVGAYVGEILRQAGYRVITLNNLPDALKLFKGSRPKLMLISAELRGARGTWTAETFNVQTASVPTIELPADFSGRDAGEASRSLLDQVRAALASRSPRRQDS